ncbi:MAG TPA: thiolase family protein [Nevskiaceae bacterium]|nr:thiolase family protein [Nevskiaceae bacterium]
MKVLERDTVISGLGQSAVGRRLGRSALDLTLDAILDACADAGLAIEDLDGLSSWPGQTPAAYGLSPTSIGEVKEALRLKLDWYCAGAEATQLSPLLQACLAVATGQARHVACFRTVVEATAMAAGTRSSNVGGGTDRVADRWQWQAPFNAASAATWTAMIAQRYFHEFGATREQLGAVALNARRNAVLNPKAIYRAPLTMDDYLASRTIATPLCLLDCDVPVDGSTVVIVSHVDVARDLKQRPVRVEAVCGPLHGRDSWDQMDDLTRFAAEDAGRRLWARTDLKPDDVDVAQLYDGFSILTLLWLEGLGFCGRGEAAAFVEGGTRIALDGRLPLNTGGGQLSAGRLHGLGHVHEAVLQLRGQAGERQVPGTPEVAAVSNGGGPIAGAALLTRM